MKTLILLCVATTSALLFFWLKPSQLNAETANASNSGIMRCPFTGAEVDKEGNMIRPPEGTVQASAKPECH